MDVDLTIRLVNGDEITETTGSYASVEDARERFARDRPDGSGLLIVGNHVASVTFRAAGRT